MCESFTSILATSTFILSGFTLALLLEAAHTAGEQVPYALVFFVAAFVVNIAIVAFFCYNISFSTEDSVDMNELLGWCRHESHVLVDEVIPPPVDCCKRYTGFHGIAVRCAVGAIATGCVLTLTILQGFPVAEALTGNRVTVRYDILMLLVLAPWVEMKLSGMKYTKAQGVACMVTAFAFFVALSACMCPDEIATLTAQYYEEDSTSDGGTAAFLTSSLALGIGLRWVLNCVLVATVHWLYCVLVGTRANAVRVVCFSCLFLTSAWLSSLLLAMNDRENLQDSGALSVGIALLLVPYLMALPFALASRGVYFVCVIVAAQVTTYSFTTVVCTAYSLPLYVGGALVAAWFQWAFWAREPCYGRKRHETHTREDIVVQMEEVGEEPFTESIKGELRDLSGKTE